MNNLKKLRKERGISQREVAAQLGIAQNSYSRYENGSRQPDIEQLNKLADFFGVSVDVILGREESSDTTPLKVIDPSDFPPKVLTSTPMPDLDRETVKIPILGCVRAGYDYFAEENIEGFMYVEDRLKATYPDAFCLRVTGDSMEPTLSHGDILICSPNVRVRTGDLAIICVNGDIGTVKRVRIDRTGITLIPDNKQYKERKYTPEQVESYPVTIQAKVLECRRRFI